MMTKQAFLDRKPIVKRIDIPEWEDFVFIKKMSAAERVKLLQNTVKTEADETATINESFKDNMDSMVKTVQMVLCDEAGTILFDDSEEDYEMLNGKDAEIIQRIFEEIMTLNGLGETEEKEAIKN